MKKILIILIAILLIGCKSKKKTTESTKVDTVYVNRLVTVYPKSLNELVLTDICDSLGNLRPFALEALSGKTRTNIKAENDTIYISQKSDSITTIDNDSFKSSTSNDKSVEIITKTVYPKFLWYSLGINLSVILYFLRNVVNWLNIKRKILP